MMHHHFQSDRHTCLKEKDPDELWLSRDTTQHEINNLKPGERYQVAEIPEINSLNRKCKKIKIFCFIKISSSDLNTCQPLSNCLVDLRNADSD